jgi:RNA polymerase sigma-70 factor (ECF subfamily)
MRLVALAETRALVMAKIQRLTEDEGSIQHQKATTVNPEKGPDYVGFFLKEYPKVVKFMMYAGANFEEADDAVSEAMARAYTSWPLLTDPTAWVRTVALSRYLRKAENDRRRSDVDAVAARLDCLDRGSMVPSGEPDEHNRVLAILRRLPSSLRAVMALCLDGYSPAEIATLLRQDANTVRSNLRHARSMLRREFQDPSAGEKPSMTNKEKS